MKKQIFYFELMCEQDLDLKKEQQLLINISEIKGYYFAGFSHRVSETCTLKVLFNIKEDDIMKVRASLRSIDNVKSVTSAIVM